MSTTCVDLGEEQVPAAEIEPCRQVSKEWAPLRDIDLLLGDEPGFVRATLPHPQTPIIIGSDRGGPDLLLRVAERLAPTDERLAREVYLEALSLEISRGLRDNIGVSAVCKAAQAAPLAPGAPQATDLALDGLIKRCTQGYAAAVPELRRALDAFATRDDRTDHARWDRLMTFIAMDLWDDQRWQDVTDYRTISTDAYSKSVTCNGLGRYEEARDAARWVVERDDLGLSGWALSELVEASTRSGHNALAVRAHASLRDRALASGTALAFGTECRASALVSEGEAADVHYRESIEYLGRTSVLVHLARSHLVYGEWLRREGRRVDARSQLRSAQMMFDQLGSKAFAERTHRELLATGETVHKRTFSAYSELTPQEDQIARLAGSRLTNSEIGTQLFISPRTVEWHLRKVFTKLGVTSRRELRFS
jgi:DNA-binding CsgD family transcriptional regulator